MWNIFVGMGVEKIKKQRREKMINFYYIKI